MGNRGKERGGRQVSQEVAQQPPLDDLDQRVAFLRTAVGNRADTLVNALISTGGRIPIEGPLAKELRRAMAPYAQAYEISARQSGDQTSRLHGQFNI